MNFFPSEWGSVLKGNIYGGFFGKLSLHGFILLAILAAYAGSNGCRRPKSFLIELPAEFFFVSPPSASETPRFAAAEVTASRRTATASSAAAR
jgi:hypothetical protein